LIKNNNYCIKADILKVNGFDERMQYGGQDRELGERLFNAGIKSKQLRYSAVVVHLDHKRLADSQVPFVLNEGKDPTKGKFKSGSVGDFVQQYWGYDPNFIWWCPLILFVYVVALRTSTTFVFSYANFNKR